MTKKILSFLVSSDTDDQVGIYMSVHSWIIGFTGGRTTEGMRNLIDGLIYGWWINGLFDEFLQDR